MGGLLHVLGARPDLAVGHSAGAAIALRMVLDGRIAPRAVVSLNGALLPFEGAAGRLFPPMAKLMFLNPLTPRVLAFGAGDRARVRRLLLGTGSTIDARGQALYERLLRRPGHLAGTLGMMAAWDLAPLARSLPRLELPVVLVAGEADRAVPPGQAPPAGRTPAPGRGRRPAPARAPRARGGSRGGRGADRPGRSGRGPHRGRLTDPPRRRLSPRLINPTLHCYM